MKISIAYITIICWLRQEKKRQQKLPPETVKKVVIPSQCAHWRGNLPDNCNIFGS